MTTKLNELFKNYTNSLKTLCEYFEIEYNENEINYFQDKTKDYWAIFSEDQEIVWAEKKETLQNDDCEGSAYISQGPIQGKNSKYVVFYIQEEYNSHYIIFDKTKNVAI